MCIPKFKASQRLRPARTSSFPNPPRMVSIRGARRAARQRANFAFFERTDANVALARGRKAASRELVKLSGQIAGLAPSKGNKIPPAAADERERQASCRLKASSQTSSDTPVNGSSLS